MKQLTIDKDKALAAYNTGDNSTKQFMEGLYGKNAFKPAIERIKSFEDACADQGVNPEDMLPYKGTNLTKRQIVTNTRAMLDIIAESLQDGWEADYEDKKQEKWFAWFEYKAGLGFVVSGTDYEYSYTYTYCGSRLCMPDEKTARYFAEQFLELHRITLDKKYVIK